MTRYVNPSTRIGGVEQVVVAERADTNAVNDAPYDDEQYVRVNGEWVPVTTPPIVPDTLAPKPPTGLSGSGTVVSGGTRVNYELTWTAPTQNTDNSPLDDFAYYVVRWRYAGSGPYATFVTNNVTAALPGLVTATNVEWGVLARDKSGNDSTWATNTITGTADTTGPQQPSIPATGSRLGTITVTWNGLDSLGNPPPSDFDHLVFYVSATTGGPWTNIGSVSGAGAVILADVPVGEGRFFSTIAVDTSGNTSVRSAENSIVVLGITAPDLEANAITANAVTSGTLSAAVTLTGYLLAGNPAGARVVIDAQGIRQYDTSGAVLINMPTNGDPAQFEGAIQTDSLTVLDNFTLMGLASTIARGAVLKVSGGTTTPTVAPTLTTGYQTYDPARWSYLYTPAGVHTNVDDSPDVMAAMTFFGYGQILGPANRTYTFPERTDSAGGKRGTYGNFGSSTAVHTAAGAERLVTMSVRTLNNGDVAAGSLDSWNLTPMTSGGTVSPTVNAHLNSLADTYVYETKLGRVFAPVGSTLYKERVAYAVRRQLIPDILLRQYTITDASFTQVGADIVIADPFAADEQIIGVTHGSSDKMGFPGAAQYIWLVHGSVKTYAYNAAATARLPDFDFNTPAGAARMAAFGDLATNEFLGFRTTTWSDKTVITKLTNNHWALTTSYKVWASFTWYDADAGGTGLHETAQSPRATVTLPRRAGMFITTPGYPTRPFPTTLDDPLSARVYIGRGATDPGRAAMERIATLTTPNRLASVGTYAFPAATSTPPVASDFPASSPGRIESADGTAWSLRGDGTATVAGVDFDGTKPGFISAAMRALTFAATDVTNMTSTTTTGGTMAARGGQGTFIAPPSGNVLVFVGCQLRSGTVNQYAACGFEIRVGATIGSGTVVWAYDIDRAVINFNTVNIRAGMGPFLVTGLTPGSTYNIRNWVASGTATASTFAWGRVGVIPAS